MNYQQLVRNSYVSLGQVDNDLTQIDPIQWMQDNFYVYDLRSKLVLYPPQIRALREAFRRDPDTGLYLYDTVIWSWPKKSAKSTVIAAVVLFVASNKRGARIRLVANDLRQADSRVGMYLRESIRLHPEMRKRVKITPSGFRIDFPNGSVVEMVPIDPQGEAGGNDDMIVFSELWGWKSNAHQKMWTEMTISPNRFGHAQRWIDTYAGHEGESPILESLYEEGVIEGERLFDDLEVYSNRKSGLLAVWITEHLLPWQNSPTGRAYYDSEAGKLDPTEYLRIHENKWGKSSNPLVPKEWWQACAEDYSTDIPYYKEVVVAADAAISNDCFAISAVFCEGSVTYDLFYKIWTPSDGREIVYSNINDFNDIETPEGTLRWLCSRYNVVKIVYDKYQLHDMMTRLRQDAVADIAVFDQNNRRYIADKRFHDIIRNRTFRHRGTPGLTEHVLNANKDTSKGKLRIVKKNPKLKIDACVSTSMACDEAHRLGLLD